MVDPKQMQIMVLDDEESIRESLADFLEDYDYRVLTAETAEEGLRVIAEQPVDVAIVDMRLPGQDGNSFILEAHRKSPRTRFIIHTGSVNYHIPPEVRDVGITPEFVFLKPVGNLTSFIDAIEKLASA